MALEAPGESREQGLGAVVSEGLGKDLVQGSLLGSEMPSSPCVYERLSKSPLLTRTPHTEAQGPPS